MSTLSPENSIISDALEQFLTAGQFPSYSQFRIRHEPQRPVIDQLLRQDLLRNDNDSIVVTLAGLFSINTETSKSLVERCDRIIPAMKDAYRANPGSELKVSELAKHLQRKRRKSLVIFSF